MKAICLLLTVIITASSFGADSSDYEIIGFSSNGTYMAFHQYGEFDGAEIYYSEVHIINIDSNKYAQPIIKQRLESNKERHGTSYNDWLKVGELFFSQCLKDANKILSNYNIDRSIRGTELWKSEITVLPKHPVNYMNFKNDNRFSKFSNGTYETLLTEKAFGNRVKYNGMDYIQPSSFKLELTKFIENKKQWTQTLQEDNSLPKSRKFGVAYVLSSVHLYQNKIAVFVHYWRPGWEGKDRRTIVVTAAIAD